MDLEYIEQTRIFTKEIRACRFQILRYKQHTSLEINFHNMDVREYIYVGKIKEIDFSSGPELQSHTIMKPYLAPSNRPYTDFLKSAQTLKRSFKIYRVLFYKNHYNSTNTQHVLYSQSLRINFPCLQCLVRLDAFMSLYLVSWKNRGRYELRQTHPSLATLKTVKLIHYFT